MPVESVWLMYTVGVANTAVVHYVATTCMASSS